MSKELKWANNFYKASKLWAFHHRKKIRKKNHNRCIRLSNMAIRKWGYYPYPPEYK